MIGLSNLEEVATRGVFAPSLLCWRARKVSRKDLLYFGCGRGGMGTDLVLKNVAAAGGGGVGVGYARVWPGLGTRTALGTGMGSASCVRSGCPNSSCAIVR